MEIRAPYRFGYIDIVSFVFYSAQGIKSYEPTTFKEGMSCKEASKWKKAMEE